MYKHVQFMLGTARRQWFVHVWCSNCGNT